MLCFIKFLTQNVELHELDRRKVAKLKELWGKGNTASQIAEIIGGYHVTLL